MRNFASENSWIAAATRPVYNIPSIFLAIINTVQLAYHTELTVMHCHICCKCYVNCHETSLVIIILTGGLTNNCQLIMYIHPQKLK